MALPPAHSINAYDNAAEAHGSVRAGCPMLPAGRDQRATGGAVSAWPLEGASPRSGKKSAEGTLWKSSARAQGNAGDIDGPVCLFNTDAPPWFQLGRNEIQKYGA